MNVKQFYIFMRGVSMKRIFLLCCIMSLAAASIAIAEPYVGIAGGLSVVNTSAITAQNSRASSSYEGGPAVSVSGGYRMDKHRFDLTCGYKKTKLKSITINSVRTDMEYADLTIYTLMGNYFLNLYDTPVTPFIGFGAGIISGNLNTDSTDLSGVTMGTQFSVGASYRMSKKFDVDLTYQFLITNANIRSKGSELSYGSNNFIGGVRYYF